jgi:hypothetical protein
MPTRHDGLFWPFTESQVSEVAHAAVVEEICRFG